MKLIQKIKQSHLLLTKNIEVKYASIFQKMELIYSIFFPVFHKKNENERRRKRDLEESFRINNNR